MAETGLAARVAAAPARVARSVYSTLDNLGDQLLFYAKVFAWGPRTLRRYKREIARLVAQVSLGRGAVALVAGTIGVTVLQNVSVGMVVGMFGYEGLRQIGAETFVGFVSAYFNTREAVPLIAGVALIATVGASFTAELGAMRTSEEIDALEVMAVPSVPYLITTRVIAMMVAVIPIYVIALFCSYLATETIAVSYYGLSAGAYEHFFNLFLPPIDIIYSFLKALLFAMMFALVMCFYGFRATGGPAGVGVAVGRAVRLALILMVLLDFLINFALYGTTNTVRIAG